jgi:tetratricopeptide (TPR) repeat protein
MFVERATLKEGSHVWQGFLRPVCTVKLSLDYPFETDVLGNADRELCRQSIALVRAGEYDGAFHLAHTAAETAPTHPLPLYLEALSLAYLSRFEEATAAINRVLAIRPESVDAGFLDCGIAIISQEPCTVDYTGILNPEECPEIREVRAPEPGDFLPVLLSMDVLDVKSWLWMWAQLKERGPYLKACDVLKLASIADLPWTADDFMSLLHNTWWTDKRVQATELKIAKRALALDPYNAAALLRKACYLLHRGRTTTVLAMAQDWVTSRPACAPAEHLLAACYKKMGDGTQMLAHLHRAGQLEEGTHMRLEEVLELEKRGRYWEALKLLDDMILDEKDEGRVAFLAGRKALNLTRMGRMEDALSVTRSYHAKYAGGNALALAAATAHVALGDVGTASQLMASIGESLIVMDEPEYWATQLACARAEGRAEAVLDALRNIAERPDASLAQKREFVEAATSSARPHIAREVVEQLAGACHDAAFYRWASCVYANDSDKEAAIRYARLVVATSPGDADAWFVLGSRLSKAGRAAEARLCFRRSEELGERHD